MEYTQVLIKPLVSEKVALIKEASNQVVFYVHPQANKLEIQQAVEKAFNVKVESVNVVRKAPSDRERQGRVVGRRPGYKKAYVTLRQGDKIEFFEGV